jgi:hypothetical protein
MDRGLRELQKQRTLVKENHLPLLGIKLQSIHHPDHSLAIILIGLEKTGLVVCPFRPQAVSTGDDITIKQIQFSSLPQQPGCYSHQRCLLICFNASTFCNTTILSCLNSNLSTTHKLC